VGLAAAAVLGIVGAVAAAVLFGGDKPVADATALAAPADAQPTDVAPVEAVAPETKAPPVDEPPVDAKPVDAKPVDVKPADAKPADAKPSEVKAVNAKPPDAKPADAKPADAKPADAKPAEVSKVSVHFESTPPGAKVFAKGALLGTTPFEKKLAPAGKETLQWKLDGYAPKTTTAALSEGTRVTVALVALKPAEGEAPKPDLKSGALINPFKKK
jgi:hypothetical protein